MLPAVFLRSPMVATKYRLAVLRLLDDDGRLYMMCGSCPNGCPQFSPNPREARLFDTWEEFVDSAADIWRKFGPCSLEHEVVYVVVPRKVSRA